MKNLVLTGLPTFRELFIVLKDPIVSWTTLSVVTAMTVRQLVCSCNAGTFSSSDKTIDRTSVIRTDSYRP